MTFGDLSGRGQARVHNTKPKYGQLLVWVSTLVRSVCLHRLLERVGMGNHKTSPTFWVSVAAPGLALHCMPMAPIVL